MSKNMAQQDISEVKVEAGKPRDNREFVYVNSAFVGSVNSVNVPQNTPQPPINGVYREQYWACSRWPYTQRILAITVGILLGALIGLAISMFLRDDKDSSVIGPLFQRHSISK